MVAYARYLNCDENFNYANKTGTNFQLMAVLQTKTYSRDVPVISVRTSLCSWILSVKLL